MNNSLNIIKFLSVIYNPNNYPILKNKIIDIAQNIFSKSLSENILNEFEFSQNEYFIKEHSYFSPKTVLSAIKKNIKNLDKNNYLYILSILYNSFDDKQIFSKGIAQNRKIFNSNIIKSKLKKLLINIKEKKYLRKNSHLDIESINKCDDFMKFYRFYEFYPHGEINYTIKTFVHNIEHLRIFTWSQMLNILPNRFFMLVVNMNNYFFKRSSNYYIKQINRNSSETIILLAILNLISTINNTNKIYYLNEIFKILDALPNKIQFYYTGLLLSNLEYVIKKDLYTKINKKFEKYIITIFKNIDFIKNRHLLNIFCSGLKNTARNCYIKILYKILNSDKENKFRAKILAKKILIDYQEKILSKDNYNLMLHSDKEKDYLETIIYTILYLYFDDNLNIKNLFFKWNKINNIKEYQFNYSYCNLIDIKNKLFHLYTVELLVLNVLYIKKSNINQKFIEKISEQYIELINKFSEHLDLMENFSIINIFNLNILQNKISNEIQYLSKSSNPNFEFISMLMLIQNNYDKETYSFIENYFIKYNKYFDKNQYRKWLNIWISLNNKDYIQLCLNKLPYYEQQKITDFYSNKYGSV